jgi:archaemetzincin
MIREFVVSCLLALPALHGAPPAPPAEPELARMMEVLRPLHARLAPPSPGDWLEIHHEEGQTFQAYLACDPAVPTEGRSVLYVQPIGTFTPGQHRILDKVTEGLTAFLGLPVKTLPALGDDAIPRRARRRIQGTGQRQLLTTYLLDHLLQPRLPEDGAACIGLTGEDLWPGKGWNFVFGQASIRNRVGVWSLARLGNPDGNPDSFRRCLLRGLGTAVHETCHMFSMRHCTAYECVMCGSNSLEEADRHPVWFCPECLAKVCFAVRSDPEVRIQAMEAYCRRNGLSKEARFLRHCLRRLETSDGRIQEVSPLPR